MVISFIRRLILISSSAALFTIGHADSGRVENWLEADKLKAAGAAEVELMEFETGGHGVFGGFKEETYPAMESFFAKALKHEG